MYLPDPRLKCPTNENIKIWRYMDFTKFVSFLHSRALHFARADCFEDTFEGSYPRLNIARRNWLLGELGVKDTTSVQPLYKAIKTRTFVNCWHMNEHESAAMWQLYVRSNEGIAVQSTFRRLAEAMRGNDEFVSIATVSYMDYARDAFDEEHELTSLLHKRKSFEHERELRALIQKRGGSGDNLRGINISVDMHGLVENIYVVPGAPGWFVEVVRSVMRQYGQTFPLVQSSLDGDPVY